MNAAIRNSKSPLSQWRSGLDSSSPGIIESLSQALHHSSAQAVRCARGAVNHLFSASLQYLCSISAYNHFGQQRCSKFWNIRRQDCRLSRFPLSGRSGYVRGGTLGTLPIASVWSPHTLDLQSDPLDGLSGSLVMHSFEILILNRVFACSVGLRPFRCHIYLQIRMT